MHRLAGFLLIVLVSACGRTQAPEPAAEPATGVTLDAPMEWPTFDDAVAAAKATGKPLLIDIYAPWCGWCRRMQQEVYTNASLVAYVQDNFAYGRLNIDDTDTRHTFLGDNYTSQELGYALGAQGTPTTVFLGSDGSYITRCPGYWDLESFSKAVQYIATGAWQTRTFADFAQL